MRRTPSLVDLLRGKRGGSAVRDADEPGTDDDDSPRAAKARADKAPRRRAETDDDAPRERRAGEPVQRELDLFASERRRASAVDEDEEDADDEDDSDDELPARGRARAAEREARPARRAGVDVDDGEDEPTPRARRARAADDAAKARGGRDARGEDDDAPAARRARAARDEDDDAASARGARDGDAPRRARAPRDADEEAAAARARRRAAARLEALAEQAAAERAEADSDHAAEDEDGGPRRRGVVERQRRAKADAVDEGDPEGLLAAAARVRRGGKRAPAEEPRMADALAELEVDGSATETDDAAPRRRRAAEREASADEKPKRKRPRRAALTDAAAAATAARGAGLVTRGVQAGLAGLQRTRRLGAWGAAALSACVLVAVLSWQARQSLPEPTAVRGLHVVFRDGPTLPADDVREWIRRGFAQRAKLIDPDADTLTRLADYLRSLAAVREVERVRVVHEPNEDGTLDRVLEVAIALREPYLPAMLADGERHWIDVDGRVLPGILPAPATARPVLRGLEVGGPHAVAEALALWRDLEPQLEPGLVSEIHLFDDLELKDQRGIVLLTRQGSRLIWGRPDEDVYGVDRARKVRDLVHTIRCQGDLSRIAVINVRFAQPFFVMR